MTASYFADLRMLVFSTPSPHGGGRTVPFQSYAKASAVSLGALQFLFLDQIIAPNGSALGDPYYGPVEQFCGSLPDASRIALFDLCRASYVKRTFVNGSEIHVSNAKIVEKSADIFARYVEAKTPEAWLWRRLSGGSALRVLALGTVAEHGLLRLFQRKGMAIYLHRATRPEVGPLTFLPADLRDLSGSWVRPHAYKRLRCGTDSLEKILTEKAQLDYWLQRQAWWSIRGPGDGEEIWRLLPVYHPRYQTTQRIQETRKLIDMMCP